MEEDLADILMKSRKVVIHMDCGGKVSWVRSLGEVLTSKIVDQWMYWLINSSSVEEVPSIYCIITLITGN